MTKFNYQKICSDLIKGLSPKGREVVSRRFGLDQNQKETLEAIGQDHGITRERVRQIQEDAILKVNKVLDRYQPVFKHLENAFRSYGNIKKEDVLLNLLGEGNNQNQVFFLLTLGKPFLRFFETDKYHTFWTTEPKPTAAMNNVVSAFHKFLSKRKTPITLQEVSANEFFGKNKSKEKIHSFGPQSFHSILEVSKNIQKNQDGFWGLREWPEINPRGIKDRAYVAFKKEQKPLHFSEVARLIGGNANVQSVHNELIRDNRFVLVGRGLYALKEMGYRPGVVRDVIIGILKDSKKPLTQEEILSEVSKQRVVQKSTVLINLNNKQCFSKNPEGKYVFVKGVSSI